MFDDLPKTHDLSTSPSGTKGTVIYDDGNRGQGGEFIRLTGNGTAIIIDSLGEAREVPVPECFVLDTDITKATRDRHRGWEDYEAGNDRDWEAGSYYDYGWSDAVRHGNRNRQQREDYPDSPIAPSWFDPADAGETWDEE